MTPQSAPAPQDTGSCLHLGAVGLSVRCARRLDWPAQWSDVARFSEGTRAAFEEVLTDLLDPADPSIWIVRRLALSSVVDGGDAGRAARGLAIALRGALRRALHGEDGQAVMRFADRGAYLARLLADVARGDGFDRWYHFRFAYLRPLPLAHALSQAIAANREHAAAALALLDATGELDAVMAALTESGAQRVLAVLSDDPHPTARVTSSPAVPTEPATQPAIARWGRGARLRLALLASALRRGQATGQVSEILAAVDQEAKSNSIPAHPQAVRPAYSPDNGRPAEAGNRSWFAPLEAANNELPLVQPAYAAYGRATRDDFPAQSIETGFAGLFLLWRSVVALGLERLVGEEPATRLTLAAVLAGGQWRSAFADPAIRWLAGCEPTSDVAPVAPLPDLAEAFAAHMVAYAAPRPLDRVEQAYGGFRVVQDAATEDWVALSDDRQDRGRVLPPAPTTARPVARDLEHFGLIGEDPPDPVWVLLARAAYSDLARRMTGLERSSAAHVARNLVAGKGVLLIGLDVDVLLPRTPLDLVLRMTGLDRTVVTLDDGRRYRLRLPGGV